MVLGEMMKGSCPVFRLFASKGFSVFVTQLSISDVITAYTPQTVYKDGRSLHDVTCKFLKSKIEACWAFLPSPSW